MNNIISCINGSKFDIEMIENNIIHLSFHDNEYIEIEDLLLVYKYIEEISSGVPRKILTELGEFTSFSSESRNYAQDNPLTDKAEAVVIKSLPQRIQFNFLMKLRKQQEHLSSFKNFDSALKWLKTINS